MEALIALFFIVFFGIVIFVWYLIARTAGKVIGGVINIADSAIQKRQMQNSSPAPQPTPSRSSGSIADGIDFSSLRYRQAKPGLDPGTQLWMETLKATVPLQSATKAVYYYSVGLYSGTVILLENVSVDGCRDSGLYDLLVTLRRSAQGRSDKPGSGQARALTAGDQSQAPYSSVLWAVENGHFDQQVINGLKYLVRQQVG